MRREVAIAALAAVAGAAAVLAVPATAQAPVETTVRIKAKVIPSKAGTPRDPQGVKIRASARFFTPDGVEKPIATHGYALLPRAGEWNGGRYPKCDKRTLDREGPDGCPKRSRIGRATGTVYADNVITKPEIEIFNGGQRLAFAYVTLYHPALVQEAIPVRIKKLRRGRWGYRVSLRIPVSLQVVAGVPIAPRSLRGQVGRGKIITTTSCPRNRRWPYRVKTFFSNGTSHTFDGSVRCRPAR
ncbi:MAG: hypothetical protein WD993_08365 [Thermoleophilaceae bacterium]